MADPKWSRRADARPQELAAAALELCAAHGVQATRVSDVAARAGVTVGTVYRYFKDKDELIAAAMRLSSQPLRKAPAPDRPGASIPSIADALRRWGSYFAGHGRRALKVALSDPGRYSADHSDPVHTAILEIEELLLRGVDWKEIRADLDARAVASSLVGAVVLGPLVGDTPSDTNEVEAVVALAVRGLRPDGPSWRA